MEFGDWAQIKAVRVSGSNREGYRKATGLEAQGSQRWRTSSRPKWKTIRKSHLTLPKVRPLSL